MNPLLPPWCRFSVYGIHFLSFFQCVAYIFFHFSSYFHQYTQQNNIQSKYIIKSCTDTYVCVFFLNCSFLLSVLTSTLVLGINYFVIMTRPLHPTQVRKRSTCSSSCYMIETYNTHHRFPCYWTMSSHILNGILWYFQRMLSELQLLLFFLWIVPDVSLVRTDWTPNGTTVGKKILSWLLQQMAS